MSTPSEAGAATALDIELPFKTRAEDAEGASPDAGATNAALGRLTAVAAPLRPPLPFLVERLLSAAGPFGLEVEIKPELPGGRHLVGGSHAARRRRGLRVAGPGRSLRLRLGAGRPRATGAFLVVRNWSVGSSDSRQLEQLYGSLAVAALERLDSLLGDVPNEQGGPRECVLYLVEQRQGGASFRLDRLQARLLEELEGDHPIAGVDLLVAHGRGTGTRPHGLASTVPTPLGAESRSGARAGGETTLVPSIPVGEVFVAEIVSPENLRWNRRASDRARALQAAAEAQRAAEADQSRAT